MDTLPIHVFKNSYGPILDLLNENEIKYKIREQREGTIKASSSIIEIMQLATILGAIASVMIAFIKARNGRQVIIKTKNNKVIQAKGINPKELENILKQAKQITAIDPNPPSRSGA
jgi:hypothetical protein